MIDAISGRVATGLAAYKSGTDAAPGLGSGQPTRRSEAATAPEGPAVIKTISPDAEASAGLGWDKALAANGHAGMDSRSGEERTKLTQDYFATLERQMIAGAELHILLSNRANLSDNQQRYAKLKNADPVPATELMGEDKTAVLKLMKQLDVKRGGDVTIFVHEDTRYLVHSDGKIEAHDVDVATSQKEKNLWLDLLSKDIANGKRDPTALQAEHDSLTARVDAMKAALFRSR